MEQKLLIAQHVNAFYVIFIFPTFRSDFVAIEMCRDFVRVQCLNYSSRVWLV